VASAFDEDMNELRALYDKTRHSIVEFQEGMGNAVGAARSKSRVVSAKVDGRGEVTELKLHTQAWRGMAPAELCKAILDTISQARTDSQQRLWKSMGDFMPPGLDVSKVVSGAYNWADAIPERPGLPKIVQEMFDQPMPNPAGDRRSDNE